MHNRNKAIQSLELQLHRLMISLSNMFRKAIGKENKSANKGLQLDQVHLPRSNILVIHQVANLAFHWVETIM